jgi:hypothetical protein
MLNEKQLLEHEQTYLRQVTPHRFWHYLITFVVLIAACAGLLYRLDTWETNTIQALAIPILSLYWWLQFRILRSAAHLASYDSPSSEQGITMFIKAYAVIRHHRTFIIMTSLAMLGLSIAIAGFLLFDARQYPANPAYPPERGILQYIGVTATGYSPSPNFPFSFMQRLFYVVIVGTALLVLTFTNSLLSASIGLWAGNLKHALWQRLILVVLAFGIFLGLHTLRETPPWACHRTQMTPHICNDVLLQIRLIDSFQAVFLTFVDGGAGLTTGLHGCQPREIFEIDGFQGRHLLAIIVVLVYQSALINFFLSRSRPKEKLSQTLSETS